MFRLYAAIFLVSCSTLAFEISLIRTFSISLSYHFSFLVISIAMLGIGAAGAGRTIMQQGNTAEGNTSSLRSDQLTATVQGIQISTSHIGAYALMTGGSMLLSYMAANVMPFDPVQFSWNSMQFLYLILYCLILSIPFYFAGTLIATAYSLFSENSMHIYASDLGGAGTGSALVLALLYAAAPGYLVVTASCTCLAGSLLTGGKKSSITAVFLLLLIVAVTIFQPGFIGIRMSPYKNLPLALKYPGAVHIRTYYSPFARVDTIKSPMVRFAPGLSLNYQEALPGQTGLAVDGNEIYAITDARDAVKMNFLDYLPSAVAYRTGMRDRVLVLDPGGGLQMLMARHFGSEEISGIQANPSLLHIVRDDYREYSGGIFDNAVRPGLGRNFLAGQRSAISSDNHAYDLIDIALTASSVTGLFGISEDYRYTADAFRIYYDSLSRDGVISISLYLMPPPRTELRILTTVIAMLEDAGVKNAGSYIAALRSWDVMVILVGKRPFTDKSVADFKAFAISGNFDPVYYPGMTEGEANRFIRIPSADYYQIFVRLLDRSTRKSFIDNYLFDIKPVSDHNPFFYYFLRLGNVKEIFSVMGRKWLFFIHEGYLTPVILIVVSVLSLFIIVLPVLVNRYPAASSCEGRSDWQRIAAVLSCFSLLGMAFMFTEVSLIQKVSLVLEHPVYSMAVILTGMLISSGAGSMIASKVSQLNTPLILPLLSFCIVLYIFLLSLIFESLFQLSLLFRMIVMFAAIIPLGVLMGIPFPAAMQSTGRKNPALIPWAWASNACLSVLAPVLAVMIALSTGINAVLAIAAISYLIAYVAMRKILR